MKRRNGYKKGVALAVALLVVAILTATTLDFHFNCRVTAAISQTTRDNLKAYTIAVAGLRIAEEILFHAHPVQNNNSYYAFPSLQRIAEAKATICQNPNAESMPSSGSGQFGGIIDVNALKTLLTGSNQADSISIDELYKLAEVEEGDHLEIFFEDESAKINVNTLGDPRRNNTRKPYKDLVAKFMDIMLDLNRPPDGEKIKVEVDLGGYAADEFGTTQLAQAIADWVDKDDNASDGGASEDRLYNYGYAAKNGSFDTLNELRFVKGVSEYQMLEKFGNYFTIYTDGSININRASPNVISALLWTCGEGVIDLNQARQLALQIDFRRKSNPAEIIGGNIDPKTGNSLLSRLLGCELADSISDPEYPWAIGGSLSTPRKSYEYDPNAPNGFRPTGAQPGTSGQSQAPGGLPNQQQSPYGQGGYNLNQGQYRLSQYNMNNPGQSQMNGAINSSYQNLGGLVGTPGQSSVAGEQDPFQALIDSWKAGSGKQSTQTTLQQFLTQAMTAMQIDPVKIAQFDFLALGQFVSATSNTFKLKAVAKIGGGTAVVSKVVQSSPNGGLTTLYFRVDPEM